ncbi:13070_t:CDS:2 [Cetraspora pellucida]|uniref:13070_t:CDS:1 n=1 Tax=Cetraspora pellucida TaxID=1433469 RepID=A0A9N9HBY9_9GLOM|nr:13070_t:CDS:2 [Cetraspora pellucida]
MSLKGPILHHSADEIERMTEQKLEPVAETIREKSMRISEAIGHIRSRVYGKVLSLYTQAFHFIQVATEPIYHTIKSFWVNFPPFRWFIYIILSLNAIPLTIFAGWVLLTVAFVLSLAGVGIVVSQGLFTIVGLIVFLPVVAILVLVAFVCVTFMTLAWFGFKISGSVQNAIGITSQELAVDLKGITKGMKDVVIKRPTT